MKSATKSIVLTKKGLISKSVQSMLMNCNCHFSARKIYTGYYSGRGRYASRCSAQSLVTSILKAQGYKYETGNDSAKGGAYGEYVKVSKVAFDFLLQLRNAK